MPSCWWCRPSARTSTYVSTPATIPCSRHRTYGFQQLLLCDVVILWRAYVLYERPRWLLLTSSLFMLLALGTCSILSPAWQSYLTLFAATYIACATLAALTYLPDPSLSITSFLTRPMPGNFELQGLLIANSISVALTLLANIFALGLITHKVMCVYCIMYSISLSADMSPGRTDVQSKACFPNDHTPSYRPSTY